MTIDETFAFWQEVISFAKALPLRPKERARLCPDIDKEDHQGYYPFHNRYAKRLFESFRSVSVKGLRPYRVEFFHGREGYKEEETIITIACLPEDCIIGDKRRPIDGRKIRLDHVTKPMLKEATFVSNPIETNKSGKDITSIYYPKGPTVYYWFKLPPSMPVYSGCVHLAAAQDGLFDNMQPIYYPQGDEVLWDNWKEEP